MRHKHASSYKSSTQRLGKVLMAFSLGLASILPREMWAQQVTRTHQTRQPGSGFPTNHERKQYPASIQYGCGFKH